nr:C39 family peptidase [Acidimicrobiia bacterium]
MTDPTDFDSGGLDSDDIDAQSFDADGDGYAETTLVDSTGDGFADTIVEHDPYTGASAVATDADGDGVVDTLAVDYDADGIIDEAIVSDTAPGEAPFVDDLPDDSGDDGEGSEIDGPFSPNEGAEPDVVDDPTGIDGADGVHGDPPGDMTYHQTQPGPVDCVPTSVAMTLSELTGQDVPAADVVAMANSEGFMTDTGMAAPDALTLFEAYGVDAEVSQGSLDGLREALDNGDSIVVGLDSADLYSGGGGPFDTGMQAGHAVVITGIDDGPPGAVYINDPGFPDGAGVEIPLDQFVDSWEDTDNTMIVAEAPVGAGTDDPAMVASGTGAADTGGA